MTTTLIDIFASTDIFESFRNGSLVRKKPTIYYYYEQYSHLRNKINDEQWYQFLKNTQKNDVMRMIPWDHKTQSYRKIEYD